MDLQKLYSLTRQAIDKYNMIEEGDKIAVGISGGKDSLTMLYALAGLRKFYPKHFEIIAVSVDLGLEGYDAGKITTLCQKLAVDFITVSTQISQIVFNERQESNPCSLCAKLRKGALNDAIISMGCNKVAYGHHKDDVIETFFLSMLYEGRLQTFWPVTKLDDTNLTIIRPLIYVSESEIIGFSHKYTLPVMPKICPVDGSTKREQVKKYIDSMYKDDPKIKNRLFTAITNNDPVGW